MSPISYRSRLPLIVRDALGHLVAGRVLGLESNVGRGGGGGAGLAAGEPASPAPVWPSSVFELMARVSGPAGFCPVCAEDESR